MKKRPEGTAQRQRHLLDCAMQVVSEAGLRGLTHRAVDRRAELPEGTCSVYYRTRLALLTALTQHVADRLVADVDRATAGLAQDYDVDAAERQTVELLGGWARSPELLATLIEMTLESVRTPSLREQVSRWRSRLTGIVAVVVERAGRPDVQVRAEVVVASLEGIVVAALAEAAPEREAFVRRTVPLVLRSQATG